MAQNSDLQQIIEVIQERYAPDRRVVLFQVEALQQKDTLVLQGETTSRHAYEDILSFAQQISTEVKNNIRLLPDEELGEEIWGVVYNSVGSLHAEPRHAAEMVTQVLLGMPVKILEEKGGWRRVQTPDRYIGWINGSVTPLSKEGLNHYLQKPKVIITALNTRSYVDAGHETLPVSDLVASNMLELVSADRAYYWVRYPDGRKAYVKKSDAMEVVDWLREIRLTGESIVESAMQLLGIPYLWGGTSVKGMDCSGFTKQVYFMHGIILARDASQQVRYGRLVDDTGNFTDALPGDLLFFGAKAIEEVAEKVVHVGIYLGNRRFTHASDYIRVNSFDPADSLYDPFNTNRYLRTKRIIGEVQSEGAEELLSNAFYR